MSILDTVNARLALKKAEVVSNLSPLEAIAKAIQQDIHQSNTVVYKDWANWNATHSHTSTGVPSGTHSQPSSDNLDARSKAAHVMSQRINETPHAMAIDHAQLAVRHQRLASDYIDQGQFQEAQRHSVAAKFHKGKAVSLNARLAQKSEEFVLLEAEYLKLASEYEEVLKYGVKGMKRGVRKPVEPASEADTKQPEREASVADSGNAGFSEANLGHYMKGLNNLNSQHAASNGDHWAYKKHYSVEHGKRYAKVVVEGATPEGKPNGQRSVHSFIDKTNGNVLKANGWKAPHPTPRGNIGNDDHGMKNMGVHGPAYLR